jgi:hypothetical protein
MGGLAGCIRSCWRRWGGSFFVFVFVFVLAFVAVVASRVSARQPTPFLCLAKERGAKKGDPTVRVHRGFGVNTACGRVLVGLGGWRAVIGSVVCAFAHTHFLDPRLRGDDGDRAASAAHITRVIPAQAGIQSQAKRSEPFGAERSDGPSSPLPCVCAEERRDAGIRKCDCLSPEGASLSTSPRSPSTAGCLCVPTGTQRTQTPGSPFLGDFFWRDKRSYSAAGPRPGSPRSLQKQGQGQKNQPRRAFTARANTSSASSDCPHARQASVMLLP